MYICVGMYVYTYISDSLYYTAETNTELLSTTLQLIFFFLKEELFRSFCTSSVRV